MKTIVFILSALCVVQQACDRHQQTIPVTNKQPDSSAHTLFVNEQERYVLTGKLDRLTISCEVKESNRWMEQGSCLIERLTEDDKTQASEHESSEEGRIFTHVSKVGNVGYHATTFYHPVTGLLIHQMRCDQPGLLNVRARLAGGKVTSRTEMQFTNEQITAGALFIPFEAEVTPDGNALLIRGEGELVLVMMIEKSCDQQTGIAARWRQACMKYDPNSNDHFDVIKVTNAMRSEIEMQSGNP